MSSGDSKFDTPIPGTKVEDAETKKIASRLLQGFRRVKPSQVPSNVPTACVLSGSKVKNIEEVAQLRGDHPIFFYLESSALLTKTNRESILEYLNRREPWEDYDICLFDETLAWCVGITHNGDIVVAEAHI